MIPVMNNKARQVLRNLVAERGDELNRDPARLASFLRDECGEQKAEIHVLVEAVRAHIPADLLAAGSEPIDMAIRRLAARMSNERGTHPDAATWAVTTWAIALGLAPAGEWLGQIATDADLSDATGPRAPITETAGTRVQAASSAEDAADNKSTPLPKPLVQRAVAWFRRPNGAVSWGKVGLAALAALIVINLFGNPPETRIDRQAPLAVAIESVSYLRQFPGDGRKAWFTIRHRGTIDRIEVQFLKGDWKNMNLVPQKVEGGQQFSFWLAAQKRDHGHIRLIPIVADRRAGEPFEFEFDTLGDGDAWLPTSSPMRLKQAQYEARVPADGSSHRIELEFEPDESGPMALELIVLRGRLDHQLITYRASNNRNGKVSFNMTSSKPENILLRARLIDSQGRRSNSIEIPYEIVSSTRAPAVRR